MQEGGVGGCRWGVREREQRPLRQRSATSGSGNRSKQSLFIDTHARSLAFFAHTNKISDNDENSAAVELCL